MYETLSPPPSPRRQVRELAPRAPPYRQYPSPVSIASSGVGSLPSNAALVPTAPDTLGGFGDTSRSSSLEFEAMRARINQLEEQLSKSSQEPDKSSSSTMQSRLIGTFYHHHESSPANATDVDVVSQSVTHKGRVFGQSHWLNASVQVRKSGAHPDCSYVNDRCLVQRLV